MLIFRRLKEQMSLSIKLLITGKNRPQIKPAINITETIDKQQLRFISLFRLLKIMLAHKNSQKHI